MSEGRVLVVDDLPVNIALLEATLVPAGYEIVSAETGEAGLELARTCDPDLVLLDIDLPGIDGVEVLRRIRADAATAMLPVVMVTATSDQDRVDLLDVGADDFLPKPFVRGELLARVKSLVRIKRYQDTINHMNDRLQEQVDVQLQEIERLGRLQRFLSPAVADLVLAEGEKNLLEIHEREITVLFSDIRGSTAFTEQVGRDAATEVLRVLHEETGKLVRRHDATVGNFTGDGLMVFFNDPVPRPDAAEAAVQMATEARSLIEENLIGPWRDAGHEIGFAQGIATGEATIGEMGFEGRFDYTVIGSPVNLAARLCDAAVHGQILVCDSTERAVDGARLEAVDPLVLKGFEGTVAAWQVP